MENRIRELELLHKQDQSRLAAVAEHSPQYVQHPALNERKASAHLKQSTAVTIPSLLSSVSPSAFTPGASNHEDVADNQNNHASTYFNRQLPAFPPSLSLGEPTRFAKDTPSSSSRIPRHPSERSSFSQCNVRHSTSERAFKDGDPEVGILEVGASTMGASGGNQANPSGPVFLGKSSAAAFINELSRNASDTGSAKVPRTYPQAPRLYTPKNDAALLGLMDKLVLPPRGLADMFLKSYWDWVHSLYPVFHRPTFMHRCVGPVLFTARDEAY